MDKMLIALKVDVPRDEFYHTFLFTTEHVEEDTEQIKERIKNAIIEYEGGSYLDHKRYRRMLWYKDELWNKHGLHCIDKSFNNKTYDMEQPCNIVKVMHLNTWGI